MSVSSITANQFWTTLKTEADAVSWNLRDVVKNNSGSCGSIFSLNRAIQSSERIVSMIDGRMEDFKKNVMRRPAGAR